MTLNETGVQPEFADGMKERKNSMRELILASASPRRRELLGQIGIPFQVIVSGEEEKVTETDPGETVKALSAQKALHVAGQEEAGRIVLGADTVVAIDGKILGKPRDRADAFGMLSRLQGRTHSVFTGVTLAQKTEPEGEPAGEGKENARILACFFKETRVHVHEMSREEIEAYLDTGDAFDKAGSYGIQGPFAAYVDGIEGDYNNVVGLPVSAVYQALKKLESEREAGES